METLYDFFLKGGVMMWPLLLCSVVALAFILERTVFWLQQRENEAAVLDALRQGQEIPADRGTLSLVARTAWTQRDRSREKIREALEVAAGTALQRAERYTPVLRTVAEVAPLLGFLGTVTGMIQAFNAVAASGLGDPQVVAGGISEALITTATGLAIAIPAYIAYNAFIARADALAGQLERVGVHLLEMLAGETAA